ncbi:hypothetical protein [Sideroxydans lithotrophicus]|uniref:Uncharacterized protein n=1 Tax=Sideroxydans lithotrophicus (strain ES-1) TaxID=580332 RepID=D5CRA7_SIDLE|nr:hypothetical protein [Sideroxydans lithotrophicus]ADE11493.1 hypothetical protein Slit_1256 [Sideroxydans lithotrophicus ES-1]
MSFAISIVTLGLGLMLVYGFGAFAMCLHAGENPASAAIHASGWLAAFSISHLFGYLAISLH